jgi:hypothetical protein
MSHTPCNNGGMKTELVVIQVVFLGLGALLCLAYNKACVRHSQHGASRNIRKRLTYDDPRRWQDILS